MSEESEQSKILWTWIKRLCIPLFLLILVGMYGYPQYNVWERGLAGKSQLKEAEWNKQIAIEEAKAELESAKLKAESEVERAKGVAQANLIISASIDEQYLRYLWVQGLRDGSSEVIYVATEAGLPIMEANRLNGGN